MGNYRHLMVYFCCCSMIFGILDVIVQPNILTYKSAFFMVVDMKRRNFAPWFGKFAVYALCGSFGIAIYGIAIHFVYRFFALERSIVNETFNMDIDDCAYNAGVFFPLDENGKRVIGWWSFAGFVGYLTIMIIPFSIILSFGFKSWRIVGGLLEQGDSEFAKNLQLQLYKALVAQTIIPVILLFIPFGLLFTLPIFEIDCQFLAAIITLIFAIYPAVDPLPILYFVDYYRIPVIAKLQMQIETFANVKTTIQICSVILSAFVNTVSIYLIITKSPKIMGTYRHLMTYFCCCSLMFSFIDAVVQPVSISTVKEFFNLEMEDVVYGAAAFFPLDKNGQRFTSYLAFFGLSCYLTLLTIPFLTMLICGLKSWKKVRCLLDHGESEFARNLQMQLYKALIAQTVLPVVFFFIPFGFIFILPIFEIDCQFMAAPVTLVFAIYPALDPLPTLFFVDYYRNAIFGVFQCKKARIEGAVDESVSRAYQTTV
ncbi:hypothetical protein B9Z55_012744 [Caenorhabditis nigoni]|nr:hypothetical protein B9Z55_012744 [Caenorhabditis nigoni]